MSRMNFLKIISGIVYISIFISSAFAQNTPYTLPQPNPYLMKDSLSRSTKEESLSLNAINGLAVDPFTGATNLNIPLFTPPGRQGIQPQIVLNYSTANPNGPLGVGWKLELGYIERSTKDGFPQYNTNDKFIFSLNGTTSELVYVGSDTYRPKREPENYKFVFDGNYWKAKDKLGRTYYFGDRGDSGSTEERSWGEIFRWYLVKIEDTLGNYLLIDYEAGHCGSPSKIYYTRHTSNPSGLSEAYIEFIYENIPRQDLISNYRPGFYLDNSKGRLYEIKIWLKESSGNRLVRRYTFEYRYSSLTNRSLLTKITELGSDGSTSLPPITFAYKDANLPAYTITSLTDNSTSFADFNGDGLTDMGFFNKDNGKMSVRLSTGNGFSENSIWISGFGQNSELLLGDFNGDGRTDLCAFYKDRGDYRVALSNGRQFLDKGLWLENFHKNCPAFVGEINGDGRNDIIAQTAANSINYAKSTGSSFVSSGSNYWYSSKEKAFIGDFEGDGLSDICEYNEVSGDWYIRSLGRPSSGKSGSGLVGFGNEKEVFPVDANNDGLTDAGHYDYSTGKVQIRIFTGRGFGDTLNLPFTFSLHNKDTKIMNGDFNGDGLTDYAIYHNGKIEVAYSNGQFPDLLTRVNNGIGTTLNLAYKPSSEYTNRRSDGTPGLPFVTPLFYQNQISDGQGNTYTTTYSYLGGLYDDAQREFAGFGYCRITEQEGSYTEKYFLQDSILRGKIYKEMAKDRERNTYAKSEFVWQKRELYPGVNLVYLAQRDNVTYDGDATFRQRRTNYSCDDYGNPTRINYLGALGIAGDEKTQITQYTYNLLDWIVSLPSCSRILNKNNRVVWEKRLYYDGAADYNTSPVKGLLTQESSWLYNPLTEQRTWITTLYEYDSFGNLTKAVDPLGRVKTIEYDTKLRIYPIKITNALGHITISTYDYGTGNILSATDVNNQTTSYAYDPLGRLIKVVGPNDSANYPTITYVYNLASRPTKVITLKRIQHLRPAVFTSYSFYDGLGRLIQTKTPAENDPATGNARQVVSGVVKFDSQGRIKKGYLPYFVPASAAYSAPDYSQARTVFAYDCLGRVTRATNPDGTYSQNTYSDWTTAFIDENGHRIEHIYDAYGRIIQVKEYNGTQVYTTKYAYNALGHLTGIIDNQNNITYFTYDSLGRQLRVNDPDMGTWNYTYDAVGNLTKQTDAKGQILEFIYDELNRLKTKKSGTATLATYSYDDTAKTYCIGRLSRVSDNSGNLTEFFYDKTGRQIKSVKTVSGASFAVKYTYDAMDRVTAIKYPDGEIVTYAYNSSGAVETIGSGQAAYVSNIDYNAKGQATKVIFGNGTSTNYTYNPNNLRLTKLVTHSGPEKIQDFSYQFDNVGNIKQIIDRVNTADQQFAYDDLNRLTQAQGRYGTLAYDYDSIGNMIYKEGITYTYGQAGRKPHALTSASDGSTLTYNNNGNLAEENLPGRGQVKYYYDRENRLIKIEPQRQELSFSVNLKPGWNFISLPVVPLDTDIFQVLNSLEFGRDYDQVARYNATTDSWEMFTNQPDFDQFHSIEYGKGYQIYVTNPGGAALTIRGYLSLKETSFPVSRGWNLVGFPYWAAASPVETGLRPLSIGVDYDTVEHYNTNTGRIEKYTAGQQEFTQLKQGEAYYLKALKNTSWKVPAQNTAINEMVELNEFVYDNSGSRVKKITPKGTTIYIGNIFEKDADGTIHKHIFWGENRICVVTQNVQQAVQKTHYYHPDHLGSSNVITDKDGNRVQLAEYTPFGTFSRRSRQNTPDITHYFTGKEFDTTGLYYYGARYYLPNIARFTQPDPIIQDAYDPQNLNHYAYCRNNPLIYTDPTGLSFGSGFGSGFGSSFGGIGSGISGFGSSLWSGIGSGISTIGNWGMQIGSGIGNFCSSTWSNFQQTMSSLNQSISFQMQAFRQSIPSFTSSLGSSFSSFGQGLGSGFSSITNSLFNFQQDIFRSQMDTFRWMGQQAMEFGQTFNQPAVESNRYFEQFWINQMRNIGKNFVPTPERVLRWAGATLKALGYTRTGTGLGAFGIAITPGGYGRMTGIIVGGATGVLLTAPIPIPGARVVGAIGGGMIGGWIGSYFDYPGAGQPNYKEWE